MRMRRSIIKPKTPIFMGCEGESEQAYGQLLNDLLQAEGHPVHLQVVNLSPGAGDPVARLRRAAQEIARRRQRRSDFARRAVLLDLDQVQNDNQRRQQAEQLANQLDIRIIWQEPCHEALLLRHLNGFAQHRPPSTPAAAVALNGVWPQYAKPMTKILLARRIGLADVRRAANVEPALAAFLRDVGLLA
jgi:hypothetical protein